MVVKQVPVVSLNVSAGQRRKWGQTPHLQVLVVLAGGFPGPECGETFEVGVERPWV